MRAEAMTSANRLASRAGDAGGAYCVYSSPRAT